MAVLTDADRKLLPLALRANGGFAVACRWYLRDWTPMGYQVEFHQQTQPNQTFLAGIATGKTTAVAASYLMDCLTIPYFRALNTSVTAKQAELPFEMVLPWIEGNPRLEHLVDDIVLRPYPTIVFKNFAQWVFRTAGTDARFIRFTDRDLDRGDLGGPAMAAIRVMPLAWGATPESFLEAVANDAPLGDYPRAFRGQQVYWTVVGLDENSREALAGLERLYTKLDRFAELNRVYERQIALAEDPREKTRILAKSAGIHDEKLHDPRSAIEKNEAILSLDGGNLPALKALVW
jgi:hypothetical protein